MSIIEQLRDDPNYAALLHQYTFALAETARNSLTI
jgi:hypothetical protein